MRCLGIVQMPRRYCCYRDGKISENDEQRDDGSQTSLLQAPIHPPSL